MTLALDERIDWFRVITELQESGFSYAAIGKRLDRGEATVIGWKGGAEPRHDDGERLLAMWCATGDHPREQAPKVNAFSFRA